MTGKVVSRYEMHSISNDNIDIRMNVTDEKQSFYTLSYYGNDNLIGSNVLIK